MAASLSIVVVEDHDSLRAVMVDVLHQQGHRVVGLPCAEDLDDAGSGAMADIFVVDLNLPGEDGLSLTRRIRSVHPEVGIIVVTARNQSQEKALGYESGADIYLSKPVAPAELLAAVKALGRRLKPDPTPTENALVLDLKKLHLRGPTGEVGLTHAETTVLTALARAPGQRLEYWQVAEAFGQSPESLNKSSLDVKIFRLRRKLVQAGVSEAAIKAIRLSGYQFCDRLIVR